MSINNAVEFKPSMIFEASHYKPSHAGMKPPTGCCVAPASSLPAWNYLQEKLGLVDGWHARHIRFLDVSTQKEGLQRIESLQVCSSSSPHCVLEFLPSELNVDGGSLSSPGHVDEASLSFSQHKLPVTSLISIRGSVAF